MWCCGTVKGFYIMKNSEYYRHQFCVKQQNNYGSLKKLGNEEEKEKNTFETRFTRMKAK